MDDRSSPAAPLRFETRIGATPEEIFPYLIDSSLIAQWLGSSAELNPVPGGQFAVDFENTKARGRYIAVDPPHRVVFTWGIPGNDEFPAGSSTVEITLTTDGDGTIVQLFHHDLPSRQQEGHAAGWIRCLDTLAQAAGH